MFSDIVGYSSLMGADEQRAVRVLSAHNKVVGMAINQHDGTVIKQMGDGVLAEFGSAVDSVTCAMDIQKRVREYAAKTPPDMRFEVRIGVHLGDVIVVGNDIIGDGVNVASRIEPMAAPGGICISQDVYNQVHNKIEIATVSLGPQQFKNIERQIEIFKVLAEAVETQAGGAIAGVVPAGDGPPVRAGASSRRTLWKGIGIGVAAVFVLLIVLGMMKDGQRRKAVQQTLATAIADARQLADEDKLATARAVLEAAIAEVRPKTVGMGKARHAVGLIDEKLAVNEAIDQGRVLAEAGDFESARHVVTGVMRSVGDDSPHIDELRAGLTRLGHAEQITNRYRGFLQNLYARDWDACERIVDPENREAIGRPGMRIRLGVLRAAADVFKVDPEKVRLKDFRFADDLTHATSRAEIFLNDQWVESKNDDRWRLLNGQWYLRVK